MVANSLLRNLNKVTVGEVFNLDPGTPGNRG